MNVAVFLPNWIGDAVMAGPALRALRKHYGPDATLIGVMRPYVADVLAETNWLDCSCHYSPRSSSFELGSWNVLKRLRRQRLDAAILFSNSLRTAMLAFGAGAEERIGYARHGRGPLLTKRLSPPRQEGTIIPTPTVDYYLALAAAVGCPPESPRLELATSKGDERAADIAWRKLGLDEDRPMVAFNCSGAYGAAKLWPVEHFAALARRVADELSASILVLCGPSERKTAEAIVNQAKHRHVVSLANEPLGIGLSKACIRRSQLLVTTDSGPLHIAAAFDVPYIGLFGPTPPICVQNPTARAVALQADIDCLGCQERTCPLGHHRCMKDLSVERVLRAVATQMVQPRRQAA
ncbi:MAG: lipopolysaccharide heptosyltransferase II [Pirellulales bacterium]